MKYYLGWVITCITLISCEQKAQKQTEKLQASPSVAAPVTVAAGAPIVVQTASRPPAQVITVPQKPGGVYQKITPSGLFTIPLLPPVNQPAGFQVHMQQYGTEQGLAFTSVSCSYLDKGGNIWFGTTGGGVSRYDGTSFTTYTTAQGLSGNILTSIAEDRSGNMWFGTEGKGVSRFDGITFTTFTTAQGLAGNYVRNITEDKGGNIWFGTGANGVSRYDGTSFTTFSMAQGLAGNAVFCSTKDQSGNPWFGTAGGVSRFDGNAFTSFTTAQGLAKNSVFSICQDRRGDMWFATLGAGVSRYDGTSFATFTTAQGLADNAIASICQDRRGNMWFGTFGGGVCRYDGTYFTTFTTAQGLANNNVFSITEDRSGNLWFGTEGGGASRYDGSTFLTFNTTNGLPHNAVFNIAEREQKLFLGTYLGIAALSFQPRNNPVPAALPAVNGLSNQELIQRFKPMWEVFNTSTGYPVKEVDQNGMFCDSKGIIWAGCDEKTGLVRFDYSAIRPHTSLPIVFLKNLKLNEENICWYNLSGGAASDSATLAQQQVAAHGRVLTPAEADSLQSMYAGIHLDGISKFYPLPQHLVLPYRHNNITIEFGAQELARPQLVNYQYKLEGYDKGWSPVLKKTSATFGHIREGSYIFKLRAQSPSGVWTNPLTYSFEVLPPWYRTWWAYAAYAALAAGVLWLLVRIRVKKLKQENDVLEHKVELRTQELTLERDRSDSLLLNILPAEMAEELKQFGKATARNYAQATVLFADMKGFTLVAEALPADQLVSLLDEYFQCFDQITELHGLEKIKTIGDAYLCAGGLRKEDTTTPYDVVRAAIDIQQAVRELIYQREQLGLPWFELRIGIHTGPVVAGVVGIKKFAYDIWGDTVNTAARMEQTSEPGKINISGATYAFVRDRFECTFRGMIQAKNKGEMEMYFVERVLEEVPTEAEVTVL